MDFYIPSKLVQIPVPKIGIDSRAKEAHETLTASLRHVQLLPLEEIAANAQDFKLSYLDYAAFQANMEGDTIPTGVIRHAIGCNQNWESADEEHFLHLLTLPNIISDLCPTGEEHLIGLFRARYQTGDKPDCIELSRFGAKWLPSEKQSRDIPAEKARILIVQ
jgi:hypothetical protein